MYLYEDRRFFLNWNRVMVQYSSSQYSKKLRKPRTKKGNQLSKGLLTVREKLKVQYGEQYHKLKSRD